LAQGQELARGGGFGVPAKAAFKCFAMSHPGDDSEAKHWLSTSHPGEGSEVRNWLNVPHPVDGSEAKHWLNELAARANDWSVVLPIPPWALAVVVSIGASTFTVIGFVIQKRALRSKSGSNWPRVGDVVLSPGWIIGFLLTAILPTLGDLAAYSLAPLSLTTPLSGVGVVLNMVIAPWALSEQLQRFPDLPATVMILIGCFVTTAFGDHDRTGPYSANDLIQLVKRPLFVFSVAVGVIFELLVVRRMRTCRSEIERLASAQQANPHLPHVILPAVAAALCGAVANIGLKGVGELVKGNSSVVDVLLCALLVTPAALVQINFISRGLFLYPQSVFMSVYAAVLVLTNTFYGACFFMEYHALLSSTPKFLLFLLGCMMIVSGIWLFKLRKPAESKGDEEKPLMSFPNETESDDDIAFGKAEAKRPHYRLGGHSRTGAGVDDL